MKIIKENAGVFCAEKIDDFSLGGTADFESDKGKKPFAFFRGPQRPPDSKKIHCYFKIRQYLFQMRQKSFRLRFFLFAVFRADGTGAPARRGAFSGRPRAPIFTPPQHRGFP